MNTVVTILGWMSRALPVLAMLSIGACGKKDEPSTATFEASSIEGYWQMVMNTPPPDVPVIPSWFKDGKVLVYNVTDKQWKNSQTYTLKDNHLFLESVEWEISKLDSTEMVLTRVVTVGVVTIRYKRLSDAEVEAILKSLANP